MSRYLFQNNFYYIVFVSVSTFASVYLQDALQTTKNCHKAGANHVKNSQVTNIQINTNFTFKIENIESFFSKDLKTAY